MLGTVLKDNEALRFAVIWNREQLFTAVSIAQIDDRMYAKEFEAEYDQVLCYGISFFKKRCIVKKK